MANEGARQKRTDGSDPLAARQEAARKLSQLMAQVQSDKKLKQQLIDSPGAVLKAHGIPVRDGLEVRVVENTDKVAYLMLPGTSSTGELTSGQLDNVVGGTLIELGGPLQDVIDLLIGPPPPKVTKLTGRYK
jgi:hypothetical protein